MKATCNRHTKEIKAGNIALAREIKHCNGCLAATIKWEKNLLREYQENWIPRSTPEGRRRSKSISEKEEHIETLTNSLLNHLIKGE